MGALCDVPRSGLPPPRIPTNNTVKLSEPLRDRVEKAMHAQGFSVWAEFCRVALTEKCQLAEQALQTRDPAEHARVYGRKRS